MGDVPVEQSKVRVYGFAANGGVVLHGHLLLQQEAREHGADEVAVELRTALEVSLHFFQHPPQLVPLVVSHADVDLLQVLPQVHGPSVDLHFLLRLLTALCQLAGLGLLLPADDVPLLHADEKTVEAALEDRLLLPALGVDRLKGQTHGLPVAEVQRRQNLAGIRRLPHPYRQTLPAQQGGELRQLFQIDAHAGWWPQAPQCSWPGSWVCPCAQASP